MVNSFFEGWGFDLPGSPVEEEDDVVPLDDRLPGGLPMVRRKEPELDVLAEGIPVDPEDLRRLFQAVEPGAAHIDFSVHLTIVLTLFP